VAPELTRGATESRIAEFSGVDAEDRLRCWGRSLPPPRLAMEVPRAGDVVGGGILDYFGGVCPAAAGVVVG
jgi:hypothetical protein